MSLTVSTSIPCTGSIGAGGGALLLSVKVGGLSPLPLKVGGPSPPCPPYISAPECVRTKHTIMHTHSRDVSVLFSEPLVSTDLLSASTVDR